MNRQTLILRVLGGLLVLGIFGSITNFIESNGGSILGNGLMMGVLSLLTLASVVFLLVGAISPNKFSPWLGSRATRKFICGGSTVLFFVSVLLNGAAMRGVSKQKNLTQPLQNQGLPPQSGGATGVAASSDNPTISERVESLVKEQLKSRFRKVTVTPSGKGLSQVIVEFKAGGSYDPKSYIEGDMMNVFKVLFYTSGLKLSTVSLKAFEEGIDKFGKPHNKLLYHTTLTNDGASKIGWANYRKVKWGDVWKRVFLHSKLQPEKGTPVVAGADGLFNKKAGSRSSQPSKVEDGSSRVDAPTDTPEAIRDGTPRDMKMGVKGVDVKEWQTFLIEQGYMEPPALGNFSKRTHEATIAFQKKWGLYADGVVGARTMAKATELGLRSPGYAGEPTIDAGESGSQNDGAGESRISKDGLGIVQLKVEVRLPFGYVEVVNLESYTLTDVEVTINPGFISSGECTFIMSTVDIEPGQQQGFPVRKFTNSKGERFDPDRLEIRQIQLKAKTPQGIGMYTGGR